MYIRTKEGSIVEVKPRIVDGRYVGFEGIDTYYTYDYKDSTILSAEELAAIKEVVSRELKDDDVVSRSLERLAQTLHIAY